MTSKKVRLGILIAVAVAVAALVLPPFINVGRYKGRVIESISAAVGRPVTVDAVTLQLLPQPGFHLENVVIGDDPAYSFEPILHAEEVTAYLRLSSLWRGRLEIARLSLKYPSLNLVERADASWNLESLLWKASRTQTAPTAARRSSSRTRFPYIEATNGRINFKHGLEKSVFSFTEADFSLWSPAENQWRMRLEARPVRTDMPVTDTGTVKTEVTLQRAHLLRDSAMNGTLTWERLQLGNLTRLIYGEDQGWRGGLEASVQFSGTPSALRFTSATKLRDFRRYDISTGDAANLNATCSGELNMSSYLIQDGDCRLPLASGLLSVQGKLQGFRSPHYELAILAENLPANSLLSLARHAKNDLPADLTANGTIAASFRATHMDDEPSLWVGQLTASDLVLHSSVLEKDLAISRVMATTNPATPAPGKRPVRAGTQEPPVRGLVFQAFDLPLGAATPASAKGVVDNEQYSFQIKGDATLERLQQFARTAGIGVPKIALAGPAAVDFTIRGPWMSSVAPQVVGSAQLKNARAEVPGLSVPVEIASARVDLDRNRLNVHNGTATIGKITLAGSASFPRVCDGESDCDTTFDLATDDLNPERWNEVFNPRLKKRPWYRLFGSREAENNVIANLNSSGHFSARHMTLGTAAATAFDTKFTFRDRVLELKGARLDMLGGTVNSDWKMDFSGDEPKYESTGTAARIQVDKLGTVAKASLGSGTLALKYKMAMSGWDAASLSHSAVAETVFEWSGGALRLSPDGATPLRVRGGSGKATLDQKGWTISASQWNTANGIYQLSGTASRDLVLAMEFIQENGAVWKVTGTLQKPQFSPPSAPQATQARRR